MLQINSVAVNPDIVIIELAAFDEHKTVASVKTIGRAFLQGANSDRAPGLISLSENPSKNLGADSCSLSAGDHIQVVKQKLVLMVFDNDETDQVACYFYAPCAAGVKPAKKSFTRTIGVKSSKPFKAFAHGLNSDGYQNFQVVIGSCA
ncbi:hypothetical protein AOA59_00380 [Pseudomonas sp. 2822-15]|nr:hypothetical protein AOA59_00380 [Pseudomonas sp. 2822-15]